MNTLTIIGQILGFVAMALIVWSFQFKDYKKLFLLQVGSCFFFVLHYLFLGLGGDPAAYNNMIDYLYTRILSACCSGRYCCWARSTKSSTAPW